MRIFRRSLAYALLLCVYGFTWLVAVASRIVPHRRWQPTGRIMVTGTFFNPNWYLSHLTPLSRSGVQDVILVVDEPQMRLERVRFVCWPHWASRVLGRTGARALWMIVAGLRFRPDLYMGYHLGPGACTALIVGNLMGRPTCYQMTGGPVEIIGGGVYAAEGIGAPLGRPSRLIEAMALAVVRKFDLIVVRGENARQFLAAHGVTRSVAIIPGSVNGDLRLREADRDVDLIFVGRLSPVKQVEQFIAVVGAIKPLVTNVRAIIVGDGPLKAALQTRAQELGLAQNIEFLGQRKDVPALLARARVFVLTSKSEGLSIAMAEAMTAGVVPVVADVGELGDLVVDGVTGYLVTPNHIEEYVDKILSLLRDDLLWTGCSRRAAEAARKHCDVGIVSKKWRQHLQRAVSQASGRGPQDSVH